MLLSQLGHSAVVSIISSFKNLNISLFTPIELLKMKQMLLFFIFWNIQSGKSIIGGKEVIVYYFQSKTEVVKLPHLLWCGLSYYQPLEATFRFASRGW